MSEHSPHWNDPWIGGDPMGFLVGGGHREAALSRTSFEMPVFRLNNVPSASRQNLGIECGARLEERGDRLTLSDSSDLILRRNFLERSHRILYDGRRR